MTSTTIAKIADINAILARTSIAPIEVPTTDEPVGGVINGESKADFAARVATMTGRSTNGQRKRINGKRHALGMRTYRTLDGFRADFPTMRDAAIEYRILSA